MAEPTEEDMSRAERAVDELQTAVQTATSSAQSELPPLNFQCKYAPPEEGEADGAKKRKEESVGVRGKDAKADTGNRELELVVVASLLDKTPNLAGLTRTCEVMGASQIVLPNLEVTTTRLFQAISVTAGYVNEVRNQCKSDTNQPHLSEIGFR